jgi:hypothetical protein
MKFCESLLKNNGKLKQAVVECRNAVEIARANLVAAKEEE